MPLTWDRTLLYNFENDCFIVCMIFRLFGIIWRIYNTSITNSSSFGKSSTSVDFSFHSNLSRISWKPVTHSNGPKLQPRPICLLYVEILHHLIWLNGLLNTCSFLINVFLYYLPKALSHNHTELRIKLIFWF